MTQEQKPTPRATRADESFCQQPSEKYLRLLEEAGGDPRSVSGFQALQDLDKTGGWAPDIESRDARVTVPEES